MSSPNFQKCDPKTNVRTENAQESGHCEDAREKRGRFDCWVYTQQWEGQGKLAVGMMWVWWVWYTRPRKTIMIMYIMSCTLHETNSSAIKMGLPKRKSSWTQPPFPSLFLTFPENPNQDEGAEDLVLKQDSPKSATWQPWGLPWFRWAVTQILGWLGYIGDEKLPSFLWIVISQYKYTYKPISIMECHTVRVLNVAQMFLFSSRPFRRWCNQTTWSWNCT